MAKYQEFQTVRLKDGRIGTITDVFEDPVIPTMYLVDVGTSPKDWDNISAGEKEIERLATPEEIAEDSRRSERELKEMGFLDDD